MIVAEMSAALASRSAVVFAGGAVVAALAMICARPELAARARLLAGSAGCLAQRQAPVLCLLALVLVTFAGQAHAATSSSTGSLPWDTPLSTFQQSIQGPVAYAISIMGVVVCGAILVFGGEIGEFVRRFIMLLLAIALLVLADQVLSNFFSGAVVP